MRPVKFLALILLVGTVGVLGTAAAAQAAQAWEIFTYGNGELLASAFSGISFFAANGLQGALKLTAIIALLAALFYAVPMSLGMTDAIMAIPHVVLTVAIVGTLCHPSMQVQVMIVDRVALSVTPISGVPFPVAAIGYLSSAFGEQMAEKLEQAMYPVDYYGKFTESGLGWGPQVVQATMDVSLLDMNLAADLDTYIRICVIPDIPTHKSVEQIMKATTADAMLGNTNPMIPVLLPSQCSTNDPRQDCAQPPADQRCPDAWAGNLNPRLAQAAQDPGFLKVLGQQIGKANAVDVLPAIDQTVQDILNISTDSVELLKLRFAANQFIPSIQANAALGGQNGILSAWSLSMAEAQQTSSWLTSGTMIQQILPYFHATLEFLFFGFLIFGIPLIIIMPGIAYHIFATALWLQLWPLAYVFANRILYMQAVKAGLYSDSMNWGMSLAAGQPIINTLNYAYAASGYPIMIGVLLLGGMIYGGEFAMTKALTRGPWQAGGSFGTDAAIGGGSVGMASYGQRNLAPNTTLQGEDGHGQNSIVEIAGDRGHPVTQTVTNASGRYLERSGTDGAVMERTTPQNDRMVMGPGGLAVEDPALSLQAAQSEVARQSTGASTTLSNAEHSEAAASTGIMQTSGELSTRLASLQSGTSDSHGKDYQQSLSHAYNQNVDSSIRHAMAAGTQRNQIDALNAMTDASLNFRWLGNGVGGGMSFQATNSRGQSMTIGLDESESRVFHQSMVESSGANSSWRHAVDESKGFLKSHGETFNEGQTASNIESAGHARTAATTAQSGLEHAEQVSTAVQSNRVSDMARVFWDENYAGQAGGRSLDQTYREDPKQFKALFGQFQDDWQRMVLDPGQGEYRAHLAMVASSQYHQDGGEMGAAIEHIATTKAGLAPPKGEADITTPTQTTLDLRSGAEQHGAFQPLAGLGNPRLPTEGQAGAVARDVADHINRDPRKEWRDGQADKSGDHPVADERTLQQARIEATQKAGGETGEGRSVQNLKDDALHGAGKIAGGIFQGNVKPIDPNNPPPPAEVLKGQEGGFLTD